MFVTKLKPISNASDWSSAWGFNDRASGTPIDLTGGGSPALRYAVVLKRRQGSPERSFGSGFPSALATYYDWNFTYPDLIGTTLTGEITIPSLGILQIFFPVIRMQVLSPGSYDVGFGVTNGTNTWQIAVGIAPVVDGFLSGVTF